MTRYVMVGNPDIGPEDAYESSTLTKEKATAWLRQRGWRPCGSPGEDDDMWTHVYQLAVLQHGPGPSPCPDLVSGDEILIVREREEVQSVIGGMIDLWEYRLVRRTG